ncbi:uncharacterized protein LOC116247499 isoform X2 [Nymphaea colorata]|uniref:uncharacterized protein LOC116247499 isoform X2 n=1 Tax=Nymphaea colorata TaxID=210225 RepID=UPI00129E5737|nr:uncharacterized protein LOC116247499 isoform X2 [Nymphaea colorata]
MGSKEEESSMEASEFPADPPNSASCLPPRKRLLAGLRMQNGFLPPSSSSPCSSLSSSSSSSPSSSTSSSLSPLLSSLSLSTPCISSASTEFGVHICDFLNGNRRIFLSPEEVIEASRSAAVAAAGIAAAAKATALEKAEIAAKAAAAAKNALELVASSTDKAFSKGVYRKGKPKKHVPVKLLYKNKSVKENCEAGRTKGNNNSFGRINKRKSDAQDIGDGENRFKVPRQGKSKTIASQEHVDDEEFAFQLHRAMNSSPRILKKTMSAALKTEDKPNDSDLSSKIISHKKHRESKYALLEKVPVSEESQICKGNATSLSDGHGNNHVESKQSTCNIVDSLATKVKSSICYPTEDCSQQCEDRSTIPHEEGKADHSMVDGKQQVGASETGSHGKLMFKHKKLLLNLSTVRNSKNQPLDLKSAQGKKSEVLQRQEESEPKGFSSVEVSAPHSFVERLTSEHDVRNKPLFMLTSSEQHEASNEASGIWNFRKLLFPQSQCVAESKSLCSLHTNPTVTTVCSSIKVDE